MSASRIRPILVTGSHRSGTTWVGKMLASHRRVIYVNEPFNAENRPHGPARHMFHYVTADEETTYAAYLRQELELQYPWWRDIRDRPHPRRLVGATLRYLRDLHRQWMNCRPLMKDPIAIFSAEWLAQRYDMDVVVMIRHPASFASSIKRLRWGFPFRHLLEQPQLMARYLMPFRDEMQRVSEAPLDIIEHAILAWRVFHHVILDYRRRHPHWIFLRHEDISLQPLEQFRLLFHRLGLELTEANRQTILEHSSDENPSEAESNRIHVLKRDSKSNIWNWRRRLQPEEIERVRQGTADLAGYFYSAAEWEPPAESRAA
jgi:hypothetical protein